MTLEKLAQRHSVRSYSTEPLSDSAVASLRAAITTINSHEAGLHFSLCLNAPEAFKGFGRSYGFFRNVRNYIVLTIDSASYPWMEEKAGYYAQMIVMKCVDMGLGTCYVGGTFSRKHLPVQLRAGWKVPAVVTIGYPEEEKEGFIARMVRKGAKRKSKAPLQFYRGNLPWEAAERLFPNLLPALKAIALAPSALNSQPVEISIKENKTEEDKISRHQDEFREVEAESRRFLLSPISSAMPLRLNFDMDYEISAQVPSSKQLIDLGIAIWNFEQLFPGYWEWGNPARFIPLKD